MIKKILMISDNDITSKESLGVTKKLLGQYKAFGNLGYDIYHLCFKDRKGVLIHGDDVKVLVNEKPKLYFTYIKLLGLAHKVCAQEKIDMCYIRYPLADFAFMGMIKKLHKICKVVVEIPTYPYDNENENVGLLRKFNFYQDRINRNQLNKYVYRFVDIGNRDLIYGVKCVNISNGTDPFEIKYIGDKISFNNGVINLIGVARVQRTHGYDRLIEGLNIYYQNKKLESPKIYFNIVGNGTELENLKDLVEKYNLERYVIFHGAKFGQELDFIYEQNNIAVAGLGGHRSGFTTFPILKNREYCAKGIPFISSLPDTDIPETKGFYKLLESSENPVDVNEIIEFSDYIKDNPKIHKEMREFAEENLTWEKQLEKVMSNIQ